MEMCPHGNFPTTCKSCFSKGEAVIPTTERAKPLVELDKSFVEKMEKDLEKLDKTPAEELKFLPSYEIDSNIGKLRVDVVQYVIDSGKWSERAGYKFLVKNEGGQIVGTHGVGIYPPDDRGISSVSSDIQIGQKGKGLAIPDNLIVIDALQRISNKQNNILRWQITNVNRENLDEKKADLKNGRNLDDEAILADPEIQSLEIEQKRWLAVYGKGGKLGLDRGKKFQPVPSSEPDLEMIDTIVLKRIEDPKTHVVSSEVVSQTLVTDQAIVLERRQNELKQLILANRRGATK
ncbi:MAG: hypothetical protein WC070_00505 [Candidatus Magasanikbacteria bacterium]